MHATRASFFGLHAAFGAVWLGTAAAAALGNYPTPVVGYGGSAILGYALSLAVLPRKAGSAATVPNPANRSVPTANAGHLELQIARSG